MKSVSELLAADDSHGNWIPLLDTAAREVFELMLSCQLTVPATVEETTMDVTAMVGLAGQLCGLLSIRCDRKTAALMTSKMLGVALDKVGPEVSDALGEICNMVGLAGQLCGLLSVRCDQKTAALMTSKMLGVALDKVGPQVSDALGEVCNMVAGNFKNKIAGLAEGCMLSPPTVITGSDYNLHSMADSPAVEVRMLFESMPIVISLQINS